MYATGEETTDTYNVQNSGVFNYNYNSLNSKIFNMKVILESNWEFNDTVNFTNFQLQLNGNIEQIRESSTKSELIQLIYDNNTIKTTMKGKLINQLTGKNLEVSAIDEENMKLIFNEKPIITFYDIEAFSQNIKHKKGNPNIVNDLGQNIFHILVGKLIHQTGSYISTQYSMFKNLIDNLITLGVDIYLKDYNGNSVNDIITEKTVFNSILLDKYFENKNDEEYYEHKYAEINKTICTVIDPIISTVYHSMLIGIGFTLGVGLIIRYKTN